MFRSIFAVPFLLLLITLSTLGCSSSTPVTQDASPAADSTSVIPEARTGLNSFTGILGGYKVIIHPDQLTGEILPLRAANAIGDVFDAHITEFMIKTPCQDCVKLSALALTDKDYIAANFKLKHPFKDLALRPDLHVFDVRGIVLTPGGVSFPDIKSDCDGDGNPNETIQTNPNFLVNADGYTTHFDDSTLGNYFNPPLNYAGNLNPFKNHFVNPAAGAFDPFQANGHNVMPVNSDWDEKTYMFNTPSGGGDIEFTFIVDASYGQSATRFTRGDPQYYLPEFNRKEAWEVSVSTFNDNLEESQVTSSAYIQVVVKDWQAQRNRDDNYPDSNNPMGLSEKSDVDKVELSIPDFGFLAIKTKLQAEAGGNGSDSNPYIFKFGPITAGVLTAGKYYGLVAVRDDLAGLGGPLPIVPPAGKDFPSRGPDITDYTAYHIVPITVRTPGTIGCPSTPIDFYNCAYTQPFGATQNASDTVVGIGSSPSNIIDFDYGTTARTGEDRFALEQGGILGVAWDSGSGGFLPFRQNEPGYRIGSIDVDQQVRCVWSGSQLGFTTNIVTVADRNDNATDTFHVWLLEPLPAQVIADIDIDPVGLNQIKVIAIETDSNDDVWVIDSENYVHKYLAGENYNEDIDSKFNLVDVFPATPAPQAFRGEVFDFVINYRNKALYILTDYSPTGSLYRIECNGTYYPFYGGNPNPLHGVLIGPHNGLADITIDNYDIYGDRLMGAQDCQLIIAGGNENISGPNSLFLTRINSQLSNLRYSVRQYGAQCMAIDPINNVLRVVHGGTDGNEFFSIHQPPVNWE